MKLEIKQFAFLLIVFLIIIIICKHILDVINSKEYFNTLDDYQKNDDNLYDVNSIDAYLIINLEKEKKRYTSVTSNLIETGVNEDKIHRIDAVYERWNGHLGCGKSHIKALEYAIDKNFKTVAILEDDFNFIEDKDLVNNSIHTFLSNFKKWDFIDLYYSHIKELQKTNIKGIDKNNGTTGAVGYIVNNNFYKILLKNRKESVDKMQEYTDKYLIKCKNNNNCKRILEQSKIAIDQHHYNLQNKYLWYCFTPKIGKILNIPSTIMRESFSNKNYNLYCFWTGDNEMTENRKKAYQSIVDNSKANVILVTPNNLNNYLIEPLHPAYKYLSNVHKSDYLRWYFMHYYGGGYSDIKHMNFSWVQYFEKLEKSDKLAIGYKEINGGIASSNPEVVKNYDKVFGMCLFIYKPNNNITKEWGVKLHNILDNKLELLKKNPSSFNRDHHNAKIPNTNKKSKYPLAWAEILGSILHNILYKYKNNILLDMPLVNTNNYI
tara:strand:+ start:25 stop:1497 length:1473 start_codon:yes stop_codon:yes gene_type:complete